MTDLSRHYSRRSLNALLGGAAAWSWNGALLPLTLTPPRDWNSLQYILLSLFENLRSAYAIGAACLKALPPSDSALQQLTNTIVASVERNAEVMSTRQAVRHCIEDWVRRDFANGAIVSVEGWLLSATEARLYALVALSLKSVV